MSPEAPARSHLTEQENHLIKQQAIFMAAYSISSIFLSLYLFDIGGTKTVAIFNCAFFPAILCGYIFSGRSMRTRSTRSCMQLGCLLIAAAFLSLLIVGPHAAVTFAWAIGVVAGLGNGMYWPAYVLSEYVVTHEATRHTYLGKSVLWQKLASTLGPPLAGAVFAALAYFGGREHDGYYVLFAMLVALLALTWFQSRKAVALVGLNFQPRKSLRRVRASEWGMVLSQQFLGGLWASVFGTLAPIFAYLVLRDEFEVSVLSGLTTVFAGFTAYIAGRALRRWRFAYLVGAIGVPCGFIVMATNHNWIGLVGYLVLASACDPFAKNAVDKGCYDAIGRSGLSWQNTFHLLVEREVMLTLGRVASFVFVLWLSAHGSQQDVLSTTLIAIAPIPVVVGALQFALARIGSARVQSAKAETVPAIDESAEPVDDLALAMNV